MDIIATAEFLSAYAAMLTVSLAAMELFSRSKAKRADATIEVYADYLHICQQLTYQVADTGNVARAYAQRSAQEIATFAKTHCISPETFRLVAEFEKECICNLDYSSKKGKLNSEPVLKFTGRVTNLLTTINSFYELLCAETPPSPETVAEYQRRITLTYEALAPDLEAVGTTLKTKLDNTKNLSNRYLIFLISATAVFVLIIILLQFV